jgi:hypothetical protein
MLTMAAAVLAVLVCLVIAAFRGPLWLLIAAGIGVTGYQVVKRCRVL